MQRRVTTKETRFIIHTAREGVGDWPRGRARRGRGEGWLYCMRCEVARPGQVVIETDEAKRARRTRPPHASSRNAVVRARWSTRRHIAHKIDLPAAGTSVRAKLCPLVLEASWVAMPAQPGFRAQKKLVTETSHDRTGVAGSHGW